MICDQCGKDMNRTPHLDTLHNGKVHAIAYRCECNRVILFKLQAELPV